MFNIIKARLVHHNETAAQAQLSISRLLNLIKLFASGDEREPEAQIPGVCNSPE